MKKNKLTPDEVHEMVEEMCKEYTKYWTDDDRAQINASMKNIATLPIWKAIYQAKKWALLTARASTVKIESEEERRAWFDHEIEMEENLIEQIKDEKKYVFVTWDPLHETVVCVHKKQEDTCVECDKARKKLEKTCYFLNSKKFLIK